MVSFVLTPALQFVGFADRIAKIDVDVFHRLDTKEQLVRKAGCGEEDGDGIVESHWGSRIWRNWKETPKKLSLTDRCGTRTLVHYGCVYFHVHLLLFVFVTRSKHGLM